MLRGGALDAVAFTFPVGADVIDVGLSDHRTVCWRSHRSSVPTSASPGPQPELIRSWRRLDIGGLPSHVSADRRHGPLGLTISVDCVTGNCGRYSTGWFHCALYLPGGDPLIRGSMMIVGSLNDDSSVPMPPAVCRCRSSAGRLHQLPLVASLLLQPLPKPPGTRSDGFTDSCVTGSVKSSGRDVLRSPGRICANSGTRSIGFLAGASHRRVT
jgi:hypothetical protein